MIIDVKFLKAVIFIIKTTKINIIQSLKFKIRSQLITHGINSKLNLLILFRLSL